MGNAEAIATDTEFATAAALASLESRTCGGELISEEDQVFMVSFGAWMSK